MKTKFFLLITASFILGSCSNNKYATEGRYESDDAYYTPGDNYISDFALVDDEERMGLPQENIDAPAEDDYYTPGTSADSIQRAGTINNYYGDVYNSPWSCNNGYCNSGFSNYCYGTQWNSFGPAYNIGWSPWTGWYTSFNFGWNYGWGNYYSWYYPGNPWYTPFYNPWSYYNYGYYNWYSPFNYYGYGQNNPYWYGYAWTNDNEQGVIFGARNPISVATGVNSTYSDNIFYSGKKDLPAHAASPAAVSSLTQSSTAERNPLINQTGNPEKPSTGITTSTVRPQTVSTEKPISDRVNPSSEVAISRPTQTTVAKPAVPRPPVNQNKPRPAYAAPAKNPAAVQEQHQISAENERIDTHKPVRSNMPVPDQRPSNPRQNENRYAIPEQRQPGRTVIPDSKPAQPQRQDVKQPAQREPKAPEARPSEKPSRSSGGNSGFENKGSGSSPSRSGGGGSSPASGPRRK